MDPTKVMELLNDALSGGEGEKIDIEIGLYIGQLSKRYGMEVVRKKLEETVKQDSFWDVIKVIDEALKIAELADRMFAALREIEVLKDVGDTK